MKFWKRGMALLLAVSACFTFLTACGQTEAAGDQLALAVCVGETPATYDPIYAEEPGEQTVLNHLYENLMRLEQDENGQTVAVNGAARSVDVKENADGTVTYTFRLRGGKWSDGVDVKAVQEVLGHEHLNTTEIYTHIDNEALRVAAKANPLSRVKIKGKIKEEPDKNHEKDEET